MLLFTVAFDDTPIYDGTETFMGMTLPPRVYGIAHWPNITPMGDVALMLVIWLGDMFLVEKVFGTHLLPWEDF